MLELLLAFALATAQGDNTSPAERDDSVRSPASIFAAETGEIAGFAAYCEIEPELIDEFAAAAEARIVAMASDDVDLVVSKVEYSNSQSRARIKAPEGGCASFAIYFAAQKNRISD